MTSAVIASGSVSLDGFIAYEDNSVGPLFDWYQAGDVEVPTASAGVSFRLTPESAENWRAWTSRVGCLVVGRTLFDYTDGWQGVHPLGVPVVVVTHEPPTDWHYPGDDDFHFVTTGVADAIGTAQDIAGGRDVGVAAGTVAGQALEAGLLDFAAIDLVPVLLGSGRRFFAGVGGDATHRLGDPTTVVAAERVMHLVYPIEG